MSVGGMHVSSATVSTALAGDPGRRTFSSLVFVSLVSAIVAPGTTAGTLLDPSTLRAATSKTDAGQLEAEGAEHVSALSEVRRLTGLTWEQISALFGVSRRAVHFWATGKPMAASHEEHLQRTLNCLRAVDRGNSPTNRQALFLTTGNGLVPFDLLVQHRYDEFIAVLGRGDSGRQTTRRSARVSSDRLPRTPQLLANAQEESVHRETGVSRPASVVRARRDG